MLIKQLSVFLENRAGRTKEVTQCLATNGINIKAFSMADRDEFGMLRLVVDNVDKAVDVLNKAGFATVLTDVVSVQCANETGSLASLMGILADSNISVEYMYAVQDANVSRAIIRPSDLNACVQALKLFGLE